MKLHYVLEVYNDDTEEQIFLGQYFSQESLEENLYKVERAVKVYADEAE